MSHNIITVNGSHPNVQGDITFPLSALSDVSLTAPKDGHVLRYDEDVGEWVNVATVSQDIHVGEGATQNYSGSGATSTASGATVYFYDNTVANSIAGASVVSSGWVGSIVLSEGDYLVSAVVGLSFSASTGAALYRVHQDNTPLGTQGVVGYDDQTVGSRALARCTVATGTTATISVRLTSSTSANSVAAQGTRHAERGYLMVRRIG